jgi:hypothetical protein
MGTWGYRAFDNDGACDWAWELEKVDDLSIVEAALDNALLDNGVADACTADCALAACEVIARLKGNAGYHDGYTENVDAWVAAHPIKPPQALVQRAAKIIDAILRDDSEFAELWAESGEDANWREAVNDLRRRVMM